MATNVDTAWTSITLGQQRELSRLAGIQGSHVNKNSFQLFLEGKNPFEKNKFHPKMQLISNEIIVDALTEEFNPQDHFTNGEVKYWIGDNFKKHVLDPAKTFSNLPQRSFSKHKFTETIYDLEIMNHFSISKSSGLMIREEILWTIANLTSKQPKGESGSLTTKNYDYTIIGYMMCDDGVVRVVRVYWNSDYQEWYCSCSDPDSRYSVFEVLSRN